MFSTTYLVNIKIIITWRVFYTDPKPTCAVTTSPPIRDQSVNLTCIFTYVRSGDEVRVNPGATLTASASWEASAGTQLSSKSTALTNAGVSIGETLEVVVEQVPAGTEIPSYTCTASFDFEDVASQSFVYATNDLSWKCVSEAVLTWCE